MHNNFITDLINFPDIVLTDKIKKEEYYLVDNNVNHIKCPILVKINKVSERRVRFFQDLFLSKYKVAITLIKRKKVAI